MMRLFVAAVAIALTAQSPITRSPITRSDSPIFRFHTGEFWLNLHHFLYVLGRAEAKMADASRDAVARAPGDSEQRLAALTADERRAWREALAFYAAGLSRKDAVFDDPLPSITHGLVFFTAGEAVRSIAPDYVPYAEATGVWQRGFQRFKSPLEEAWKSYLDGKGTRDEAITALIAKF